MRLHNAFRNPQKRVITLVAVAAGGAAFIAANAHADFTATACTGGNVAANGSTLQNGAQTLWSGTGAGQFNSADGCQGKVVSYNGSGALTGSGAGRAALGSVDGNRSSPTANPTGSRFVGTDEPPTAAEMANMNTGNPAITTDDAQIHVIPVAATAIAVVINEPTPCVGLGTNRDASGRLQISNDKLVKVFSDVAGGQSWGDIIQGLPSTTDGTNCAAAPIHRIVRPTGSGSTFAFKNFLNKVAGSTVFSIAGNTTWPGTVTPVAPTAGSCTTDYCSSTPPATGGGDLRNVLTANPGGIGYLALSDARNTYDYDGGTDSKYWLPISKMDNSSFVEPTADANGFHSATWVTNHSGSVIGSKGASCNGITPAGIPTGTDPTLGDWNTVDLTGGTAYPICTLTYDLAFNDDAPVWGGSDAEQAKARTVKDYLTYVTSIGQSQLGNGVSDYSQLSLPLRSIAQNGVSAITWNKVPDVVKTETTTPTKTVTVTTPISTTTKPVQISNKFTITSAVVKNGAVKLTLTLPGPGKVTLKATTKYKGKTITFGTGTATVKGGSGTLTLKPGSKAKSAIKKTKTSSKLKVSVAVKYTPTGGASASKTKSVSVKGTLKVKHKH
jgi:hypothetical protein